MPDKILTHKIFAIPIFLCIMLLVFYLTFDSVGAYLSSLFFFFIEKCISFISYELLSAGVNPAFHSLIVNGICSGIGSVLSFLPRIAIMFCCLSILENSGYLSRVALVTDDLLTKLGLPGESIIPLLIGFGCAVPAIMSAGRLPCRRHKYLTVVLIPFMSCSAKLPIYVIFTAVFFSEHRTLVLMSIYLIGIAVAVVCALILKYTYGIYSTRNSHLISGHTKCLAHHLNDPTFYCSNTPLFYRHLNHSTHSTVRPFPPYMLPPLKPVLLCVAKNVRDFIKKVFTIVLMAAIIIWFLQNFNADLQMVKSSEESLLALLGKQAVPFFAPLGFGDWRAASAVIAGLSAKEAVVGTLAVLATTVPGSSVSIMLPQIFSSLSAFSFMVFCLLYMPCAATLVSVKKELGKWRYVFIMIFSQITIAWIVSFLIFNIGTFLTKNTFVLLLFTMAKMFIMDL